MSTQIVFTSKNQITDKTQMNESNDFANIVECQREYFNTDATKSIDFRIHQLKKLKKLIRKYEDQILEALNIMVSPVNGLTPWRALVAGFLITRILNMPGHENISGPDFCK